MLREIKYRGRRVDNGEWIYGNLIGNDRIVGDIVDWHDDYFCTEFWYMVNPETIGQFTGLQNCNGTDIYKGDILQFVTFNYDGSDNGVKTGYVDWEENAAAYVIREKINDEEAHWLYLVIANDDEVEIIGNIFQHPELLKEEQA